MLDPGNWPEPLVNEINKRLTLNLLIQGAAAHTFLTASHLVRDELESISPGIVRRFDRFAIGGMLNYLIGDPILFAGRPNRWGGFSRSPQTCLSRHRLMATHGNRLATESYRYLAALGRRKGVVAVPGIHYVQFTAMLIGAITKDTAHRRELERLATRVNAEIWGLPTDRMDARLTRNVRFGTMRPPATRAGRMMEAGIVGLGGVERRGDHWHVVARAVCFPLLVHELVKATVELICLHGLTTLGDADYRAVIDAADHLELETYHLQSGIAFWRRFLAAKPSDLRPAAAVMRIAKLPPSDVERFATDLIERPDDAADRMQDLR